MSLGDGQGERGGPGSEAKRKYKRHPKPDDNAPERPPSAYVLFSNAIREEIKGQDLSFTDIAKLVGQRWQSLSAAEREPFESKAASLKETFNQELAEYKKTEQYRDYSQYLADFKAKHGGTSGDGKRPKLEEEQSGGSLGSPGAPTVASSKSPKFGEPGINAPGSSQGRSIQVGPLQVGGASGPGSSPVIGLQSQSGNLASRPYSGSSFNEPAPVGRSQELGRPSPRVGSSATSGGEASSYFDHPTVHGSRGSATPQIGGSSTGPFETGMFSRPKPQLLHQDTVMSNASSAPSNLSYGSGSTGALHTPRTPRDDPWTMRLPQHDAFKSPSGSWDVPRPVHPPFASPHGTSFAAVNALKVPERSFPHHNDPALRLPPPNVGLGAPPHESPGLSMRSQSRPGPSFSDARQSPTSRPEMSQTTQRPEKESESPLDLLAQAVDARDSRPERRPP